MELAPTIDEVLETLAHTTGASLEMSDGVATLRGAIDCPLVVIETARLAEHWQGYIKSAQTIWPNKPTSRGIANLLSIYLMEIDPMGPPVQSAIYESWGYRRTDGL
jgi:hypothetical protein